MSIKTNKHLRLSFLIILLLPTLCFSENLPFKLPKKSEILKLKSAVIKTNKGNIYCELFPELAPKHVANLKFLADKGYYKNTPFYLYEKDYVIQGGLVSDKSSYIAQHTIEPEFSDKEIRTGSIVMLRKPNDLDFKHTRHSHPSKFRILLRRAANMDGRHTLFAQVVKGFDVVKKLRKGDVIEDLIVYVRK